MAERIDTRKGGHLPLEVPYPSKVQLPVRRPAIVRRGRLIERLTGAHAHRLTLVSAPAGYGKTTLLLDFAQSWEQPVCWFSLDERDCDLQLFLRYFAAAGAAIPGFAGDLLAALSKGAVTPERATDLMVAACEKLPDNSIFILDDFHYLDECEEDLRQAVEGWLYRLPRHCHVVLAGRTNTELSVIPMMSVRQEVGWITAADFAFTTDEVAHLFRDALGKEIALDDAQHLADLTEGWAAALVLMADKVEASRTAITLEQLRESDTLFRYMTVEQYEPLSPDVREFLTGSAVLRNIDERNVNELLNIADAAEKLNYLEHRNLFVVRKSGGFRYHHLFRAFLVSKLRTQDPARFQELNQRAAAIMERLENWEEAVYHFIQVAAWDRIVKIAENVGWQMFEEGRWDTLADWLDAVPAEALAGQPRLVLWKARILLHLNQVDRALALLASTIASLERKQDWTAVAEALITKGMCQRVKGDHAESRSALERACSILREHEGSRTALTEARKELGITLSLCGELGPSIAELTAVLEEYEAAGDTYNIAHTSDQLGVTLGLAGRLAESASVSEQARQRWMKLGNSHRLVETLINLSNTYYLQGDNENSESVARQGLELARTLGNVRPELYLLAALGDIKRQAGEYAAALELYNSCLEQAWSLDDAYIRIYTTDAIAGTYQLMGDLQNGESWSKRAIAEAEKRGGAVELGLCLTTAGLLKRQQGELKDAAELLELAIQQLRETDARRELAKAHFHMAGVCFPLNRKRLALDHLEAAAAHVAALGYDHFLLVEAARNPLLIQYAAANKLADGYYARMLKLIKGAGAVAPAQVSRNSEPEAAAEADASTVVAYGFGKPRVEVGGHEISDLEWRAEKGKEMFFFFLCNRRPLRKEEIVTALWPELAEDKTTSAFHSNMYRLRKALYQDVIAKDSGRYILDPRTRFVFDVEQFQQALKAADDSPKGSAEAITHMEKALAVYKGQFAPDFYTEWAETLRWQMEEQYMSLLTTLAAAYSQQREFKRSAELCQKILEMDEFNEAAWYRLMSNYIHSGQDEAAKFCYNRYAQIIARDLDGEAPPSFDEVFREIARTKPGA